MAMLAECVCGETKFEICETAVICTGCGKKFVFPHQHPLPGQQMPAACLAEWIRANKQMDIDKKAVELAKKREDQERKKTARKSKRRAKK